MIIYFLLEPTNGDDIVFIANLDKMTDSLALRLNPVHILDWVRNLVSKTIMVRQSHLIRIGYLTWP